MAILPVFPGTSVVILSISGGVDNVERTKAKMRIM
jgi:hypothetical protein